jgi:hypothetical protein
MTSGCGDLLLALKSPQAMTKFSPRQWDEIIPLARAAGLLGRLGWLARIEGLIPLCYLPAWHAMEGFLTFSERQAMAVHYELTKLDKVLSRLSVPVLVLKGAAYVASGSPAAGGRIMSDIDILVPKPAIQETEAALMRAGWISSQMDAYDQRYYRQWMHEIPPMQHIQRGTVLDVHHNLLPETARIKTFPDKVIAAARPLPGMRCLHVPSELDLILHSATHLMHEGEWDHGLRDLVDLLALISDASVRDVEFSTKLSARARELRLEPPMYYAFVQLQRMFATSIPALALSPPNRFAGMLTNALLTHGLASYHSNCRKLLTPLAVFLLYVRSHWLRMPARLLIPHLLHKAFKQETHTAEEP